MNESRFPPIAITITKGLAAILIWEPISQLVIVHMSMIAHANSETKRMSWASCKASTYICCVAFRHVYGRCFSEICQVLQDTLYLSFVRWGRGPASQSGRPLLAQLVPSDLPPNVADSNLCSQFLIVRYQSTFGNRMYYRFSINKNSEGLHLQVLANGSMI